MNRRDFCAAPSHAMMSARTTAATARRRAIEPMDGTYSQSLLVTDVSRWLWISGQVPASSDGTVPRRFREQFRLAWHNVERQLTAAGMTFEHLVKVTVYLADRRYRDEARAVRQELLGQLSHPPALTVVAVGIYDRAWLVEIEAVAAA